MATGFLWGLLNIIFIDLALAGDNALLIASAARHLEKRAKRLVMFLGVIAAVVLRILFLAVASRLLGLPYLYFVGGAYLIFVALRLLGGERREGDGIEMKSSHRLFEAVWIIASADALMSLDNVVAIAGASGGNYQLFILGVAVSIPIIFFGATFLSALMQRYSFVVLIGSVVLVRVGGKMIAEEKIFAPFMTDFRHYALQILAVFIVIGYYFLVRKKRG